MRHLTRIPLALTAIAAFNVTGATVLAESPVPDPFPAGPVLTADLCDQLEAFCSEPEPDPDPVPNPAIPAGPDDLTDDPCDPVEEICGDGPDDPEKNPDIPDGPDDLTADPCDPVEEVCGDGPDDPGQGPDPDPDPQPEPCPLDDVCTRTPTFTG